MGNKELVSKLDSMEDHTSVYEPVKDNGDELLSLVSDYMESGENGRSKGSVSKLGKRNVSLALLFVFIGCLVVLNVLLFILVLVRG